MTPTRTTRLETMGLDDLDSVMAIELRAYPNPWTRGNFVDSLRSGCCMQCLRGEGNELLGYFVALEAGDEVHLLNLTVAPEAQRRGHAIHMLDSLARRCRQRGASQLWLEVRNSNLRARRVYEQFGFRAVGVRKSYYPAADDGAVAREDAVTMGLTLERVVQ